MCTVSFLKAIVTQGQRRDESISFSHLGVSSLYCSAVRKLRIRSLLLWALCKDPVGYSLPKLLANLGGDTQNHTLF